MEGCKKNRQNWLNMAEHKNKQLADECNRENECKDDECDTDHEPGRVDAMEMLESSWKVALW